VSSAVNLLRTWSDSPRVQSTRDVSYGRSLEDQTDSTGAPVDSTFLRSDVKVSSSPWHTSS